VITHFWIHILLKILQGVRSSIIDLIHTSHVFSLPLPSSTFLAHINPNSILPPILGLLALVVPNLNLAFLTPSSKGKLSKS
jgi:hypothetical protein